MHPQIVAWALLGQNLFFVRFSALHRARESLNTPHRRRGNARREPIFENEELDVGETFA